jgi:hypothetical protein
MFQVKEVALPARRRNARLSFAFVYPDKNGRFVVKQVRVYLHCKYLAVIDLFLQCNLEIPILFIWISKSVPDSDKLIANKSCLQY